MIDLFQFHKGAIKTRLVGALQAAFANFNSIKVRLKLAQDDDATKLVQFISIP